MGLRKKKTIFDELITEVTIYRTRKVSLGPYETEDIHIGCKASVNSKSISDLDIKYQELSRYTEAMIKREEAKLKQKAIKARK
jgi:hypothetical protein